MIILYGIPFIYQIMTDKGADGYCGKICGVPRLRRPVRKCKSIKVEKKPSIQHLINNLNYLCPS
jgi:hypothetical protein